LRPDGPDAVRRGPVHAGGRGGLGQAIPLEDGEADTTEEVTEPFAQRSAAGDGEADLPAQCLQELAVDELAGHHVLEVEPQGRAAGVLGAGPLDGGGRGPLEDLQLAADGRLLLGGVVDLLEDTRYGEHE